MPEPLQLKYGDMSFIGLIGDQKGSRSANAPFGNKSSLEICTHYLEPVHFSDALYSD
jgi:hypothetical protein